MFPETPQNGCARSAQNSMPSVTNQKTSYRFRIMTTKLISDNSFTSLQIALATEQSNLKPVGFSATKLE